MEANQKRLADGVGENNRMTAEMYVVFQTIESGLTFAGKLFNFLSKVAKPFVWILIACGAVWTLVTTGKWPTITF